MNPGTGDQAMLELFRIEVENQTEALNDGLLAIERGEQSADLLETLMRAAHSIKGAANLVKFAQVVELSHVLEDVFVAMQQGRLSVQGRVDGLLAAVDFLAQMGKLSADTMNAWMGERASEADSRIAAVRDVASATGNSAPQPSAAPEGSAAAAEDPMLELFRVEVENQLDTLSDGLIKLEKGNTAADLLETLMRAAHSIKGAAKLVELEPAVALAHVLEDVFSGFQQGAIQPSQALVDVMLGGLDFFSRIARVDSSDLKGWVDEHRAEAEEAADAVRAAAKTEGASSHDDADDEPQFADDTPVADPAPSDPAGVDDAPRVLTVGAIDPGMMEVFRAEVEAQSDALNECLLAVEKGQAGEEEFNRLMSAMHTIKGAARLIGLDPFVDLAHRAEDAFGALKAAGSATREQVDTLLGVVDLIVQVAGCDAGGVNDWLGGRSVDMHARLAELAEMIESAPATSADDVSVEGVSDDDGEDDGTDYSVDPSMFDLARGELDANLDVLAKAKDVESLRGSAFEPLVRAVHSIKGTVRILGVEPMVNAATALEEQFRRVHEGKQPMTPALRDCLKQTIRSFDSFRRLTPDEVPAWVRKNRKKLDELTAAINQPFAKTPSRKPSRSASTTASTSFGTGTGTGTGTGSSGFGTQSGRNSTGSFGSTNDERRTGSSPGWGRRAIDKVRERYLRVTADHLDKLMALSGESLVEARRLAGFNDQMVRFKQRQQELFGVMHDLLGLLGQQEDLSEKVEDDLKRSRRLLGDCREMLNDRLGDIDLFAQRSTGIADRFHREVMDSRMRPFSDGTRGFPRMVRDVARQLGKQVQLEIEGDGTLVDREILEKIEAPINHMLRNAIDHGLESPDVRQRVNKPAIGRIRLIARHSSGMLQIIVADDGRGVDIDWLRDQVATRGLTSREIAADLDEEELLEFLFLPNFSTAESVTDISGRGVGLNVVQDTVRELGGALRCSTSPGEGMEIEMLLPISVSVLRGLLVKIGGEPYAFPLSRIERTLRVPQSEMHELEGRQYITLEGDNHLGLVQGTQVLELGRSPSSDDHLNIVVISDRQRSFGLIVDELVGQHELVVQALDLRLGKVKDISAAALLDDGSPALIIDVEDLLRSIELLVSRARLDHVERDAAGSAQGAKAKRVLVVDDSITVREVQRKLLTAAGYVVEVAVDGMDGWNAVRTHDYDMVISDIDMPRMNGIEFVRHIKNHPVLKALPVLIVSYKDREEDRQAGLEAGADYYLTKSSFQDETLIEAVQDLIGAPV